MSDLTTHAVDSPEAHRVVAGKNNRVTLTMTGAAIAEFLRIVDERAELTVERADVLASLSGLVRTGYKHDMSRSLPSALCHCCAIYAVDVVPRPQYMKSRLRAGTPLQADSEEVLSIFKCCARSIAFSIEI